MVAPPRGLETNNSQTSTQLIGQDLHEIHTIRAGQSVVFECNAIGQPRPRVRWFRFVGSTLGGATGGTNIQLSSDGGENESDTSTEIDDKNVQYGGQTDATNAGHRQHSYADYRKQYKMQQIGSKIMSHNNIMHQLDGSQFKSIISRMDTQFAFGDSLQRIELRSTPISTGNLPGKSNLL